ncbi:hypothetical protein [Candidatus Allofournierella merdipullorum]|uniref:hypothetical protein n=1 Tax=Candidatus Allofournierella merdipullorum TaxID=2838595 RepID=UPI00374E4B48
MAFTKITDADLQGKGVVGQAPVPGLPVKEMQESVEQIVREVAIPGINRLADELSAQTAAKNIGMQVPDGMPGGASANVSSVVGTHVLSTGNPHKVTAEQVGAYTKEQTDQAINQKVQDIGAGDMSKSEYARTGTYGAVDRALSADRAVQSDDGVKVYTHTKSGTVHNFAGSGANGRAKLTADVQAGDTFTVNGVPVAAYVGADSAADAMAGGAWNGRWVSFTVEGGTLNFKGGGGKVTVTGLAAGAVKKGTTVTVKQGAKTVASVVGTYKGVPCLCYCCVYCHPDDWNGTRATLTSFDPSFIDTKNAYSTNGGSVTFTIKRSAKIRCYSSGAENYNHNRMTIKIDGTTLGDGTMLTVNNGSKITIPYNAPGSNRGRAGAFCIFESD